eukprot:6477870-Amphidinium_carterae.1
MTSASSSLMKPLHDQIWFACQFVRCPQEVAKELLTLAKEAGATVGKFQKRNPKELLTKDQYEAECLLEMREPPASTLRRHQKQGVNNDCRPVERDICCWFAHCVSVDGLIHQAPHPNPANSYGDTYGAHREFLELGLEDHRELQAPYRTWASETITNAPLSLGSPLSTDHCKKIGLEYSCSVWDTTSAKEIIQLNPVLIKVMKGTVYSHLHPCIAFRPHSFVANLDSKSTFALLGMNDTVPLGRQL